MADSSEDLLKQFDWMRKHRGRLAPSRTGRDYLRLELFEKQNGVCYWHDKDQCKLKDVPLSLERVRLNPETGKVKANPEFASFEHVVRRYDGGKSNKENMALAHAKCNHDREKGLPPNGLKYRHLLKDAHKRQDA